MASIEELKAQQQLLLQRQQAIQKQGFDPVTGQRTSGFSGAGRVLGNIQASIGKEYQRLEREIQQQSIIKQRETILAQGGTAQDLQRAGVSQEQQDRFFDRRREQPVQEVRAREAVQPRPGIEGAEQRSIREQVRQKEASAREEQRSASQAFESQTATRQLGRPVEQIPFSQKSGITRTLVTGRPVPIVAPSSGFAGKASTQKELQVTTQKGVSLKQTGDTYRPIPSSAFISLKPQEQTKVQTPPSRERPAQSRATLEQVFNVLKTGTRIKSQELFSQPKKLFDISTPKDRNKVVSKSFQLPYEETITQRFERLTDINRRQRELGDTFAFFLPKSLEPTGYAIASRLVASEETNLVPIFTALPRATRGKEVQVRNILGVLTKSPKLATSKETPVSDIGVGFGKFLGRPTEQAQLAAEGYAFGGALRFLAKGVTLSPTLLRAVGSPTGQFLGKTAGVGLLGVAGYSEYADVQAQPTERLKRERIGQIPGRFASFGLGVEAESATLGGLRVRQTRFGEPFGEIQREASIQRFTKSPPQREFLRTLASAQRELRVKSPQPTPKPLTPESIPGEATLREKTIFRDVIREEEGTVFGGLSRERTFGTKVKEPTDPDIAFKNVERALNKLDFDLNTPELRTQRFERVTGGIKEPETLGDIKPLSELNQFAFREKDIRLPSGERFTRQSEELGRLLESFLSPGRLERRGEKDITAAKQLTQYLLEEQARVPVGKRRAKRLQDIRQRFEASKDVQFTFLEQPRKTLTKTIGEKLAPFRPERNIFEELGISQRSKQGRREEFVKLFHGTPDPSSRDLILKEGIKTAQQLGFRRLAGEKKFVEQRLLPDEVFASRKREIAKRYAGEKGKIFEINIPKKRVTELTSEAAVISGNVEPKFLKEYKERLPVATPEHRRSIFAERKLKQPEIFRKSQPSRFGKRTTELPSFLPRKIKEKSRLPFERPTSKIITQRPPSPFEPRKSQLPREPSPFPKPKPSEITKTQSGFTPSSFKRTPSEFTPSGFTDRSFFNEPSGFRTPPAALFGLKGGEIASVREGRGFAPQARYAPSLTGILRGIKISKIPKTSFSGFEVRGVPVKRLGGLAGNIGARLRREFRLPVSRKQGKRRSKSRK